MRETNFLLGGKEFAALRASQVMERDVRCFGSDAGWEAMAEAMTKGNFGSVPVVDDGGRFLGMVTEEALLSCVLEGKGLQAVRASQIMTDSATVTGETGVVEIARLLRENNLIRVPVVTEDGRVIGVVARRDLIFAYLRATDTPPKWL